MCHTTLYRLLCKQRVLYIFIIINLLFVCSAKAQKIDFKASKRRLDIGESTTFKWHVKWVGRKDSIFVTGVDDPVQRKGELTIVPDGDKRYFLTVKKKNGKKVSRHVNIKVRQPEIKYFTGPDSILAGSVCMLKWKTVNAVKVSIENHDDFLGLSSSAAMVPNGPIEYTLKACNAFDTCVRAVFKVKVMGDFVTGPSMLKTGESGYLQWHFKDAVNVEITGVENKLPSSGKKKIAPSTTTEYKFIVSKPDSNGALVLSEHLVKVPVIRTSFVKGIKDYFTLPTGRKLIFDIFAVQWDNYPEEIMLKVMITDTLGNYIRGLAPPYISEEDSKKFFTAIIETIEGKSYPVNDFEVKEFRTMTSSPNDVAFVLDYSGSMSSCFNKLDKSTRFFISRKHAEDRLGIVRFDDSVGVELPLIQSSNEIFRKIAFNGGDDYSGGTALYAAADAGIRMLDDTTHNKHLLLLTDGFENSSMFYWGRYATLASEVITNARKNNVLITTIDYGGAANTPLLEALADMSGGNNYQLQKPEDIEKVFMELQHLYHNYYELRYRPAPVDGDRTIDLIYNDNTGHLSSTRTHAYIKDSVDIVVFEEEGINTNPSQSITYNNMRVMNRQTVALFDFEKSFLDASGKSKLDVVVDFMKKNPTYKIVVLGYSDLKGEEQYCERISKERALEVKQYLRSKGIPVSKITAEGKGKADPVWLVEDVEWKARENRRVDILYLNP